MMRCIKWMSITFVLLIVSIGLLIFFLPKPPLLTDINYSRAVYDNDHRLLRLTLSADSKYRLFTPLEKIDPTLISATLLQEDQYFYWHAGINPVSFFKAAWLTYAKKSRRMGASTISMQVARMRFRIHSKTLSGKVLQILRALQLEAHYNKRELLEAYLNLAPYGNNVEGVGAASLIYFNKSVSKLNLSEALTLVVIPQNPTQRIPDHGMLKEIRNKLYLRWLIKYPQAKSEAAMMNLPLQIRRLQSAPFYAPHFVNTVLQTSSSGETITTLDLKLQQMVERITDHYLVRKKYLGVNNAAVLILDTRKMSVKAMLGSADFFNSTISGQINGTLIKRSPGSTLKPFIYALALDQGIIHPGTVLKDAPHSFGSYNPENFDNDFLGPVKAKDALILSRNIPAVYLADQLKKPNLYAFLQAAGIKELKSESYYGLALVLGGAELSMQELVELYAMLNNEGVLKPLRLNKDEPLTKGKQLLSKEASFLVLEMLKETQLSNQHFGITQQNPLEIAWKTGTSSGYRDAWTIGIAGPYVIAVWLGNFDNRGNPAFIGKEIAAPLFFELVNAMNAEWHPIPIIAKHPERMHLAKVEVCKASGMLPTSFCTETESVWFIPGKSPIKTDTIYREVAIDTKTGLRACQFDQQTKFAIYEFWPSDLLKIFKRAGIERRMPPPYTPGCELLTKNNEGLAPQIISPQKELTYITRLESKQTIIPFTAVVDADISALHWFLNETYLGKTSRDQAYLWHAKPGRFAVRVVDNYGRSDLRNIEVKQES